MWANRNPAAYQIPKNNKQRGVVGSPWQRRCFCLFDLIPQHSKTKSSTLISNHATTSRHQLLEIYSIDTMKASWLKYFPITTLRQVGAGWSAKSARRAGLYLPHANRRSRGYSTALDRLPMSVYYGSQSGTAQMLAHLFTQEADQQDIQVQKKIVQKSL